MNFIRPASILLASLPITACIGAGAGDDDGDSAPECPATGAPLLPELPRVQPVYTDGCEDETWASEVEAEATWTIALQNGGGNTMAVVPSADGVVAISDRTARWVTSAGEIINQRDLGASLFWNRVQGSTDGVLVVAGSTGGTPLYRVLDASGGQVWLRLLEAGFGTPSLWLEGSDVLVGVIDFTDDTVLRIQRWGLTGTLEGELVLPAFSDPFVRDGAGRFAVMWSSTVQVFGSDGAPLGQVEVGVGEYPSLLQIVGADDGFYAAGGEQDPFVARIRVDGMAEVAWTYRLGDPSSEWGEYATGLAALPEGGVVVVGGEDKIRVTWPDSPLGTITQPFVLALDAEGQPIWGERIGVPGRAMAVGIGSDGGVYVAGMAQASPAGDGGWSASSWLRRYDAG